MSTNNINVTETNSNGSETNVNAMGIENPPSKVSSTSSSPHRTSSIKSNSPSINKNTQVRNSREIVYEMDKNGIESNGSPKAKGRLSRHSVYPSVTNLTARDAFGRIRINFLILLFFMFILLYLR